MARRNASLERFKRLTDDLKKECLQIAHDEMGEQAARLVGLMKGVCPVEPGDNPRRRPGALRDSIGWTFGDAPRTRATGAFRPKPSSSGETRVSVYAGNDEAFYARWVEFGTAPHSLAKGADISRNKRQSVGAQHPGAAPHPFFYPTYRLAKKSIQSAVKRKLAAAIKKRSAE